MAPAVAKAKKDDTATPDDAAPAPAIAPAAAPAMGPPIVLATDRKTEEEVSSRDFYRCGDESCGCVIVQMYDVLIHRSTRGLQCLPVMHSPESTRADLFASAIIWNAKDPFHGCRRSRLRRRPRRRRRRRGRGQAGRAAKCELRRSHAISRQQRSRPRSAAPGSTSRSMQRHLTARE